MAIVTISLQGSGKALTNKYQHRKADLSSINLPRPSNVLLVIVKSTFLPSGENFITRLLQYLEKEEKATTYKGLKVIGTSALSHL